MNKPILSALTHSGAKISPPGAWIMRQAGRYLPEYRKIREKSDFLTMCHTPELACEVTLQPLRRFPLDGAILFSDILIPLEPMGVQVRFEEGVGPLIDNPVTCRQDVDKLLVPDDDLCPFVGQTLQLLKKELEPHITLLGFAGAPFTLASYVIEGGSTKTFLKTKSLMYNEPEVFSGLMDKLTEMTKKYLLMQSKNGADALQLFDSWAGQLSPQDYEKYAHPWSQQIIDFLEEKNIPVIHFAKSNAGFLSTLNLSKASGIAIGWDINLEHAASVIHPDKCIQGNLDPAILFAPEPVIKARAIQLLKEAASIPHSYVFNLGHGIFPNTPIKSVEALLDTVKSFS
ncbi:MAG: uroporphyrinogen decarboxylase [Fibrobacteria bacterium]|nr:uroporphyrinogen decarboxylase [Fibrobacteria bacterium]